MAEALNPWDGDLLDFAAYGSTFTNLIQSIPEHEAMLAAVHQLMAPAG